LAPFVTMFEFGTRLAPYGEPVSGVAEPSELTP